MTWEDRLKNPSLVMNDSASSDDVICFRHRSLAKWQEQLILAFANSSASGVAQNAEGLITNPDAFNKEIAGARSNGILDMSSINKIVALRNSASITMFTHIPSCLDTDTRMSLDVDEEYKKLKIPQLPKTSFDS
jgi:hypothetical protein